MDKSELIAALRNDKETFQQYRRQNPDAAIDLSGADLSECDLSGVSLADANLQGANLSGSDCTRTSFRGANLSHANLRRANLDHANLHQTIFEGADLDGVDLGDPEGRTRMCLHSSSFRGTHWSKSGLESVLDILNQNARWDIQYQLVPKRST